MIDIESLDTTPSAHILSIGACLIHEPAREFYVVTGTNEQDRRVSNDTINWWCEQSQQAQDEVLVETDKTLREALEELTDFIKGSGAQTLWSHGSGFDLVILEHAYRQLGMKAPWNFWSCRDTRTMIEVAKRIKGKDYEPNRQGTYHHALDDAQHQSEWMRRIWEALEE